jgi:hypothetical protein
MSTSSWFFLVHDLNISFARTLDKHVISKLKRWVGLFRGSDVGTLFRLREHLGLQLTSIEYHFEHLQLVTCCLLENSSDETVRAVYKLKKDRVSEFKTRWAAPNELSKLDAVAEHNLRFAGQTGRAGLGSLKNDPYIAHPTMKQRREKITSALSDQHEEDHVRHASTLVRQGVWTHWEAIPFDFSWPNLLYGPGPHVIRFVLNAQINSVRTPDMLKPWGYQASAECKLCGRTNAPSTTFW